MKERILFTVAAGVLTAATWWVWIADPGRIPALDFNRQVLAETEVEGYCAGRIYWTTNAGSASKAKACRNATPDMSTEVNHAVVIISFCRGVLAEGFPGNVQSDCADAIAARSLWPTMDGRLTSAFDDTKGYPYPGDRVLPPPPSDSRTGSREGFDRGDEAPPTTTGDQE
jgi:hypothetical protein